MHGRLVPLSLVTCVVTLGLGVPSAVAAVPLPASSTPLPTEGSYLYMSSEPGDFIGQGQEFLYTDADSTLEITGYSAGGVSARVVQGQYDHFWYVDLAAPDGTELLVGSYEGATRTSFREPDEPGIDVTGDGRGCSGMTGAFDVLQLERGPGGELLQLDVVFEQHCDGFEPALFGRLRIEVPPPAPDTTAPVIEGPETLRAEATDDFGADVDLAAYGVYALDDRDPSPALKCAPASGTRFTIGATTVSCTARDASGNSASRTLTVEVVPRLQVTSRLVETGVTKSGAAVLSFEVTCTRNATVAVGGLVEQVVAKRAYVTGSFLTSVPCTSEARTTVSVTADRGYFRAGQAALRWSTEAYDELGYYSGPAQTAQVRLRSAR